MAKTELLRVKSEDGKYDLPLRIVWPLNYDKNKKYPDHDQHLWWSQRRNRIRWLGN
jgi:hypothetical protein